MQNAECKIAEFSNCDLKTLKSDVGARTAECRPYGPWALNPKPCTVAHTVRRYRGGDLSRTAECRPYGL